MDDVEIVDQYFQNLICRPESTWTESDRVIYCIVATRCEMDMNGFDSVFSQLLKKRDVQFLIDALRQLDERQLAGHFQNAFDRLQSVKFFDNDSVLLGDLSDQDSETEFLADIEGLVRENDQMWDLDRKLASLVPMKADQE